MERGEPMITSMKMKAFDAESVTSEMLTGGADTAEPATADSPDSSDKPTAGQDRAKMRREQL